MSDDKKFVLLKYGLYWRPDGNGYTGLLREAGLYSLDDAAMVHCEYMLTPAIKAVTEYMLHDDAPEFAPACYQDVIIGELKAKVERLGDALCLADSVIMEINGCFPLDGPLNRKCRIIRGFTGDSYKGRARRAEKAELEAEQ